MNYPHTYTEEEHLRALDRLIDDMRRLDDDEPKEADDRDEDTARWMAGGEAR